MYTSESRNALTLLMVLRLNNFCRTNGAQADFHSQYHDSKTMSLHIIKWFLSNNACSTMHSFVISIELVKPRGFFRKFDTWCRKSTVIKWCFSFFNESYEFYFNEWFRQLFQLRYNFVTGNDWFRFFIDFFHFTKNIYNRNIILYFIEMYVGTILCKNWNWKFTKVFTGIVSNFMVVSN